MGSFRVEKVNHLIRDEISKILLRELDVKDAIITITHVKTSKDLLYGRIYLTIFPENKEKEVLRVLEKQIFYLQQILNKKLQMRPVPKINFLIDEEAKIESKMFEVLR